VVLATPEQDQHGLTANPAHDSAGVTLSDSVEDNNFLRTIKLDDDTSAPLAKGLKHVRQKFNMGGAEYNEYWRLVIKAYSANEANKASANASAASLLTEIQIKNTTDSTRQTGQVKHAQLMQLVQSIANRFSQLHKAQAADASREDTLRGLLTELDMPTSHPRLIRDVEYDIRDLEDRIAMGTLRLPDVASVSSTVKQASARETISEQPQDIPVEQEIAELKETLWLYKQDVAAVKDAVAEQRRKLHSVWKKKQEIHAKRQDLLKQLMELKKESQHAKIATGPQILARMPTGLDFTSQRALEKTEPPLDNERLDELVLVKDTTVHQLGFGTATVTDTAALVRTKQTAQYPPSTERESAIPVAESDFCTGVATRSKGLLPFGLTSPPDAASQLSTSQIYNTTESLALNPVPSDTLYLKVPASSTFYIDDGLTVDLSAPIHSLQTQAFEMHQRLRSSYPRIDSLPYEVWTSSNIRTLQIWLKIMIGRWKTRFDDVDIGQSTAKAKGLDEDVRAVLDHMVRDHDLSNEAAKRMAKLWKEIVSRKGVKHSNVDGVLDRDELEAGGDGFLAVQAADPEKNMEKYKDLDATVARNKVPACGIGPMYRGSKDLLRRLYSTSARPPHDPEVLSSTGRETLDSEPTSSPAILSQSPAPYGAHLPHLTPTGNVHMVSVSAKPSTVRTAIAVGTVYFSNPTPLSLIRSASLKKGDVLGVSRIAGIMAAKRCPDIVPLCHPISLSHVSVELTVLGTESNAKLRSHSTVDMGFGCIEIEAKVQCTGPTGVEMEALTAVMGAALSVVDMCKAVDKSQRIHDVRVVRKEGGRSGTWVEEGWEGSGPA